MIEVEFTGADSYPAGGATGDETSYTDSTIPADAARRYYRVLEQEP